MNNDFEMHLEQLRKDSLKTGVETFLQNNAGIFETGAVFEAETMKGHKNYVVFMFVKDGWVYYMHGDRAKKVRKDQWNRLIDYGDLEFIPKSKVDPEKKSLAVLSLMAMANGLSFNDYLKVIWGHGEGSQAS